MGSRNRDCNWQPVIYVVLSFAISIGVTLGGWLLTLVILLTTRHMHGAGPLPLNTHLIAPATGIGVALAGFTPALRHWRRLRSGKPEKLPAHSTPCRWP